jgi:hypothetical protein
MLGRTARVGVAAVLVGALAPACSGETDLLTEPTTPAGVASVVASSTAAAGDFCSEFEKVSGLNLDLSTKEAWEARLAATELVTRIAPNEVRAEAEVYLQMVEDRVALVAAYDYVAVTELPADVRSEFIAAQQGVKAQADAFISFAKETCRIS